MSNTTTHRAAKHAAPKTAPLGPETTADAVVSGKGYTLISGYAYGIHFFRKDGDVLVFGVVQNNAEKTGINCVPGVWNGNYLVARNGGGILTQYTPTEIRAVAEKLGKEIKVMGELEIAALVADDSTPPPPAPAPGSGDPASGEAAYQAEIRARATEWRGFATDRDDFVAWCRKYGVRVSADTLENAARANQIAERYEAEAASFDSPPTGGDGENPAKAGNAPAAVPTVLGMPLIALPAPLIVDMGTIRKRGPAAAIAEAEERRAKGAKSGNAPAKKGEKFSGHVVVSPNATPNGEESKGKNPAPSVPAVSVAATLDALAALRAERLALAENLFASLEKYNRGCEGVKIAKAGGNGTPKSIALARATADAAYSEYLAAGKAYDAFFTEGKHSKICELEAIEGGAE